jgi:hypothetical protein
MKRWKFPRSRSSGFCASRVRHEPATGSRAGPNGAKTAEVCRGHGISGAMFYAWKARFGGMEPSEAKRLKALDRAIARHWFEGNGEGERQAEAPAGRGDAR